MFKRSLRAALLPFLFLSFGAQLAQADIYTWTDANGRVNVSNLAPPAGVRVSGVVHENPEKIAAQQEYAREAARQAEVQVLADRVRQLEREADYARRAVPAAMPMPMPMPYPVMPQQPPVQYA